MSLLLHGAEIAAPRLTRDRRHLQYRVRCDGASCGAVHFNFDGLQAVSEPGRYDVVLALGKNAYNASVSAQVEVKALHRLEAAAATTSARRRATRLRAASARRRAAGASCSAATCSPRAARGRPVPTAPRARRRRRGEEAAAVVAQARREGRLRDRRGRSAVSTIAALAATGERVLVLVADVARRRPLLTRDALPPALGRRAMYLQAACANRLPRIGGPAARGRSASDGAGPDVVMAGVDLAAAHPELVAAFGHVVFVDPPFGAALHDDIVASAAPDAYVHASGAPADVHFSEEVLARGLRPRRGAASRVARPRGRRRPV